MRPAGVGQPGIYRMLSSGAGTQERLIPLDRRDAEAWPTDWSRDTLRGPERAPGLDAELWPTVQVTAAGNALSIGKAQLVFRKTVLREVDAPYDVSDDGQHFVLNRSAENAQTPLTLVTNWEELLKSK